MLVGCINVRAELSSLISLDNLYYPEGTKTGSGLDNTTVRINHIINAVRHSIGIASDTIGQRYFVNNILAPWLTRLQNGNCFELLTDVLLIVLLPLSLSLGLFIAHKIIARHFLTFFTKYNS